MLMDAELREYLCLQQAKLEFEEAEARMRDVDTLHQVRIRLKRIESASPVTAVR